MTDYKSMFEQAVRTLAAIDEALGIGDDGCCDPDQTLDAIACLKASPISEEAMDILRAENDRLKQCLFQAQEAAKAECEANAKLELALQNCRLLAARHRKEDWALLILGFCAEGGVVGSVTRELVNPIGKDSQSVCDSILKDEYK